jgi:hypothetical protein
LKLLNKNRSFFLSQPAKLLMTQKAIIFDHDGVLVDTEPLHSRAWIEILDAHTDVDYSGLIRGYFRR